MNAYNYQLTNQGIQMTIDSLRFLSSAVKDFRFNYLLHEDEPESQMDEILSEMSERADQILEETLEDIIDADWTPVQIQSDVECILSWIEEETRYCNEWSEPHQKVAGSFLNKVGAFTEVFYKALDKKVERFDKDQEILIITSMALLKSDMKELQKALSQIEPLDEDMIGWIEDWRENLTTMGESISGGDYNREAIIEDMSNLIEAIRWNTCFEEGEEGEAIEKFYIDGNASLVLFTKAVKDGSDYRLN